MTNYNTWYHPYKINEQFTERVAYFSMEFGVHQALKIYSGGLGFLAGSHMRSAYDLKQNLIGVGILWKYGYYDQVRHEDQSMRAQFTEKHYSFLEDTGIQVQVTINKHPVWVKAFVLKPETFGTVPLYLLTTDVPENDHLARTITHKLYDNELLARIAQSIVLGIGGAKVVEALGGAQVYHMNEAHALPLAFQLYERFGDLAEVRKRLVFTTHTPEKAGNEEHEFDLLDRMSFFGGVPVAKIRRLVGMENQPQLSYTLAALRMARMANGVSQLHGHVARQMWSGNAGICPIAAITNAQHGGFWADKTMYQALQADDSEALIERKSQLKQALFEVVADQTGKLFRTDVLTLVWARRFAEYKRPDLLVYDLQRLQELTSNPEMPLQVIWAGKPYPFDHGAISVFNRLVRLSWNIKNVAVLTGYEIELSRKLKQGTDVWLNTPRHTREASGTSGMTAAMNGTVNFTIQDGWIPEFGRHGENSFLLPVVDANQPIEEQDRADHRNLLHMLETEVLPTYYRNRSKWVELMKNGLRDVAPFESGRMAAEYYSTLYKEQMLEENQIRTESITAEH